MLRRAMWITPAVIAVTLVGLVAGTANAMAMKKPVSVHIIPQALVVDDGSALRVPVIASCSAGGQVLEGILTVNQDGNEAQGFFAVQCDGKHHRVIARVAAIDFKFEPGRATASSFLLVLDPETGGTSDDQDSALLRLREP
jgi:hypothetical protein